MGMTPEQVADLIENLELWRSIDRDEIDRPGLGLFHKGRAEAFGDVISHVRLMTSGSSTPPERT
jgi:hypothetical protein